MKSLTLIFLCLGVLLLGSPQVQGAERYISDTLIVSLRDTPSRTSNIIGHLRSGDYMTILEEDDNGYLRVRVSSGIEGWIPKKYTSEGKSKDTLIRSLKKSIASLEEKTHSQASINSKLTTQINDYQATIDSQSTREAQKQAEIQDLKRQVTEAQDKYITLKDHSEGVEEIFAELETLRKDNESLTQKLTVLTLKNRELDQTKNIFWFLTGAGVLLMGFIIGRTGRKGRRNSLTM